MKKVVSKMFVAGALAALVASVVPTSSVRAQLAPAPDTGAVIKCSIVAELNALDCKRADLSTLSACLSAASQDTTTDAIAAADAKCDRAADASLTKCEFTGAAGDLVCRINPNSQKPTKLE